MGKWLKLKGQDRLYFGAGGVWRYKTREIPARAMGHEAYSFTVLYNNGQEIQVQETPEEIDKMLGIEND